MSFDALLGNEQLESQLRQSLRRGNISHCYLISGPEGSGKHTLARLLAAAILCTGGEKPCLRCHPCRKVLEGIHPDFITVDDPERKTVPVELIRTARADVYIQPNEADRKIYLFPRAQDMGVPAQNALLKVLEEPPAYGVFLLLTDNPEKLLPTVRSRCRELKLQSLPEDVLTAQLKKENPQLTRESARGIWLRSGGFLGPARSLLEQSSQTDPQTEHFVKGFAGGSALALAQSLVPMEKWKRDALIPVLQRWLQLLEEALACKAGGEAVSEDARLLAASRSAGQIHAGIRCLQKGLSYAQGNVSPGAVCGWLLWALAEQ